MATATTAMWKGSVCPQARLTVTQASQTGNTATLSWKLEYVTHGYKASTNGDGRAYSVTIDGKTVKSGTTNINGKTTYTVASGTTTVNKNTSSRSVSFKVSFTFDITWSGSYGGTKTASSSISISAKTSYKVSYNANGGSGAPGAQTKWYGTNLTLSSTKPTRTGYTFNGWNTNSSGTGTNYAAGATYSGNAALTLYAKWTANTYTVSFDANGGTGAPSNQTKTYGSDLTLSSTVPTRTNYNFLGWGTSASSTTVAYAAGAKYTSNSAITLYAVWELAYTPPTVTNLVVDRADSAGTLSEDGTYVKVAFDWVTDANYSISSVKIEYKLTTATSWTTGTTLSPTGKSGKVNAVTGGGNLSTENVYDIRITIADTHGSTVITRQIASMAYIIDFLSGGTGVAFGKPANKENTFEVNFPALFDEEISVVKPSLGRDAGSIMIEHGTANYDTMLTTKRTDTDVKVGFGIGATGKNHGVYSYASNIDKWMIYGDSDGYIYVNKRRIEPTRTLASGFRLYMSASQTVNLSSPVSEQESGIVLSFAYYNGSSSTPGAFNMFFVPKQAVAANTGRSFMFLGTTRHEVTLDQLFKKVLYINDNTITGSDYNTEGTNTTTGIANKTCTLNAVYGV